MALSWNTPAGSLGTINERDRQEIVLNVSGSVGPVDYTIISGNLPRGLRLESNKILGTPLEVKTEVTSTFVVRATDSTSKKDRTFSITVQGSDNPYWVTNTGLLPVGPNSTFFVLDNDKVDFQLVALDPDIPAGDTIEYYIPFNGGELPPGLSLSKTGRIKGFTDPIFSLDYNVYNGNYDLNLFDNTPYDLGIRPTNGWDSFLYDEQSFDFYTQTNFPRRLTRYYQFTVVASDGILEDSRNFQIYVVSEDYLRSDNTVMQVGTGIFRADNTFIRNPIWITESELGLRRANNHVTVYLDVYNPPTWPGVISFRREIINPEFYGTLLLTVRDTYDSLDVQIKPDAKGNYSIPKKGKLLAFAEVYNFTDSTLGTYYIKDVENLSISNHTYRIYIEPMISSKIVQGAEVIFGTASIIPDGLELDSITGELTGRLGYQPAVTKSYTFTVTATSYDFDNNAKASTPRTFNLKIIGEIESGIQWNSGKLLGNISPNKPSQLYVDAISKLRGGSVIFQLESGTLPPGLSLLSNGDIIGKVNQTGSVNNLGITRFYNWDGSSAKDFTTTTYDSNLTSFDRTYTFVIAAKDIYNYAESSKTFQITVSSIADITYSNLSLKVFQKKEKRTDWYSFISNATVFDPNLVYRYGDPEFGVQKEMKMLVYAGIESVSAVSFVQAIAKNHKRKRFLFGDVKKAVAKDIITQEILYEVVYVDIIDPLVKNGRSISKVVELPDNINKPVLVNTDKLSVDTDGYFVSDADLQKVYASSIKNMRSRVNQLGLRDRTYLPLWMRSIQADSYAEPGFVSAIPICYCRPQTANDDMNPADQVILNIKNDGFDFKTVDFEADRYLIDSIDGILQDQYIAFPTGASNPAINTL